MQSSVWYMAAVLKRSNGVNSSLLKKTEAQKKQISLNVHVASVLYSVNQMFFIWYLLYVCMWKRPYIVGEV